MRSGFTLIELLLVFGLAILLLTMLFGALLQSNRLVRTADEYINQSTALAIAHHQLEKDISGACVPLQVYFDETLKKDIADPELTPLTKDIQLLKKVFFLEVQKGQLKTLTFISNNPTQAYWSERIGTAQPALIRVVYRLTPGTNQDQGSAPSFTLMRQSGSDLNFENYTPEGQIREYELLSQIKRLSVSFAKVVETKQDDTSTKELEQVTEWDSDTIETGEDIPNPRYIPNGVTITLLLWDEEQLSDQTFVITIPIITDSRLSYTQPQTPPPLEERKKSKSMVQLPSETAQAKSPKTLLEKIQQKSLP